MTKSTIGYIGLGSNLGDRRAHIEKALKMLSETSQVTVLRVSDLIETVPLSRADEPKYLNATAQIETTLDAENLLGELCRIESALGRQRKAKWSPRVIDLDLLLFGDEVINRPGLAVPHPQMHLRSFVLKGLCQLNAELRHPLMGESVGELAARLGGADFVIAPNLPQLISVAGIIGVGKTTLTKKLSDLLGCKSLFEAYDTNPFMPQVYAGRSELALDSQLYFLASRVEQLNPDNLVRSQAVVSDYVFDKEMIYARRLLDKEQLSLYEKMYDALAKSVAKPVLTIYLQDSAQNCLERIHTRNRPYEQRIQPEFLEELAGDYEQLFERWQRSPVIRVQMSEFDCNRSDCVEYLAKQIKYYIAV